jgi:hypothetical protein
VFISTVTATATARRRNEVGVVAWWSGWRKKNHTHYFHLASLNLGPDKKGFWTSSSHSRRRHNHRASSVFFLLLVVWFFFGEKLNKTTETLCNKSGRLKKGIWGSRSISLSLSLKERRRKLWEWTVKIMLGWRGRLDFHRKGNVDTCRARLIRWRFEEEETANLQLIQSSPDLLLNFKLHPFSNLNHVLVYKSHLTCALLWVTCFFF